MIDFFFLVLIAIGMGLVGLASFMWTLKSGQYDDLEGAPQRILFEASEGPIVETERPRRRQPYPQKALIPTASGALTQPLVRRPIDPRHLPRGK
jgi:cbb3-type cytochrome oxidase maturation protein